MGMLKKVGIFLGIKYEPLSDPPVIKICEWGPWGNNPPSLVLQTSAAQKSKLCFTKCATLASTALRH